ncbi:hypothetical protein Tcan_13487 [Toxocara canis]|uniref:Uncharacterized protein n=1 Tax=Toxocara canis TaxID=6265 RepID=A0A0B2VPF8_TOXCA|nr:hypothetical protein Tcan_13487 [Toxocara canis]
MARNGKAASEMRSAIEEIMAPIADGMRKTMEHMTATMAEEMREVLLATIREAVSSLLPKMVRTLTHSLQPILNSNCERLQTIERDTANAENSSRLMLDAEEQQRQRSAVFIGVEEACGPPSATT